MKNVKKLLMAFVLVALLISSVVTIAIAETAYTGTVEQAQPLLDAVIGARADEETTLVDAKAEKLKTLYNYLVADPIDPEDEGCEELMAKYDELTFKVAYAYYKRAMAANEGADREAALIKLCEYTKAAHVMADNPKIAISYKCSNDTCGTVAEVNESNIFGSISDILVCPDACPAPAIVVAQEITYSEFEKMTNDAVFASLGNIIDTIFDYNTSDKSGYYDLLAAREAVVDFLESVGEVKYVEKESNLYTGSVESAAALLADVDEESTYAELKAALQKTYLYLVATPVNPTSDGYQDFFAEYTHLASALTVKFDREVKGALTVGEKTNLIKELYDCLAGVGETPAAYISEAVVKGYNDARKALLDELEAIDTRADALVKFVPTEATPSYRTDFAQFSEKVTALETLGAKNAYAPYIIDELYAIVTNGAYDSATEGLSITMAKYNKLCAEYVTYKFADKAKNAVDASEKYGILVDFREYLTEMPLCESAINVYNELRVSLVEDANELLDKLGDKKVPVYIAPEKPDTMVSVEVLEALSYDLLTSYNEYMAATAEDKAAALDTMKTAASVLYNYILVSSIDTEENYYADFIDFYTELRTAVSDALLATVTDAEGDEAKLEALRELSEYLAVNPVNKATVVAYNALVDELGADASMKLSHVYLEIDALSKLISAPGVSIDSMIENAIKLHNLKNGLVDVTDEAYALCSDQWNQMTLILGSAMYDDILVSLSTLDSDEFSAVLDGYIALLDKIPSRNLVLNYTTAVRYTEQTLVAIVEKIESGYEKVAYYTTEQESVIKLINAAFEAEDFDDKWAQFVEIYNSLNTAYFNTNFMASDSYEAVMTAYSELRADIEAHILEALNEKNLNKLCDNVETVYNYLTNISFSEAVIEAYNAKVTELAEGDYHSAAAVVMPAEDLIYKAPYLATSDTDDTNIWSQSLDDVKALLDAADRARDKATDFYGAFLILGGFEETGARLLDFGTDDFAELVEHYFEVKGDLVESKKSAVKNAGTAKAGYEALVELREFNKDYPVASELVKFFNDSRLTIVELYDEETVLSFNSYLKIMDRYRALTLACDIKTKYLDSYQTSRFSAYKKLINGAKYSELQGYFEKYESLEGETALIYQNLTIDKINNFLKSAGLAAHSDSDIVSANIQIQFAKLIDTFAKEIETLSDDAKNSKIDQLGQYMLSKSYPMYLVELYNAKFGKNLIVSTTPLGEEKGDLLEFAEIVLSFGVDGTSDEMKVQLTAIVEYAIARAFSTVDVSTSMNNKANELNADVKERTEEQKALIEKNVPVADYSNPVYKDFDMEDSLLVGKLEGLSHGGSPELVVKTDGTGNKYALYASNDSTASYLTIGGLDDSNGLVLEFDIMSPDGTLNMGWGFNTAGLTTGATMQTVVFNVKDNRLPYIFPDHSNNSNDTEFSSYREGEHDPIEFIPGEWTHISIVLDPQTYTTEIFVDYVSIGTKPILTGYQNVEDHHRFTGSRMTAPGMYTNLCYDNLQIYGGTSPRTLGKFDSMSTDAKFKYFVECAADENVKPISRFSYYNSALELKDYVSSSCDSHKQMLENIDLAAIKTVAQALHLANMENIIAGVDPNGLTTENIGQAILAVDSLSSYISTNRQFIDQASARFIEMSTIINQVNSMRQWFADIQTYVDAVGRFRRATSYDSMIKHAATLNQLYKTCQFDTDKMYSLAVNDPLFISLIDDLKSDDKVTSVISNVTLKEFNNVFVPIIIETQLNYENSYKIIDTMSFIEALVEDKDLFATEEEYFAALLAKASENESLVDPYLVVIRDFVNRSAYDASVEGVDYALRVFKMLDEMFFEKLQKAHFTIIKEKLDRYAVTDSYIEKAGICTFVRTYIAENNVDMSSQEAVQYMHILAAYEQELEAYKADYETILATNTQAFIGIVNEMGGYSSYSKIKPLYDKAISDYYYSMNSDSAEAKAAIKKFAEIEAQLEIWEADGAMFVGYVNNLRSARRQAQRFRALVNCSKYADKVDAGVAGVKSALSFYNEQLAEYNDSIGTANSEIETTTDVVCSLRTNSLSATVLAVIKNVFTR